MAAQCTSCIYARAFELGGVLGRGWAGPMPREDGAWRWADVGRHAFKLDALRRLAFPPSLPARPSPLPRLAGGEGAPTRRHLHPGLFRGGGAAKGAGGGVTAAAGLQSKRVAGSGRHLLRVSPAGMPDPPHVALCKCCSSPCELCTVGGSHTHGALAGGPRTRGVQGQAGGVERGLGGALLPEHYNESRVGALANSEAKSAGRGWGRSRQRCGGDGRGWQACVCLHGARRAAPLHVPGRRAAGAGRQQG